MSHDSDQASPSQRWAQGYAEGTDGSYSDRLRAESSSYDAGVHEAQVQERMRREAQQSGGSGWFGTGSGGSNLDGLPLLIMYAFYAVMIYFVARFIIGHVVEPIVIVAWRLIYPLGWFSDSPGFWFVSYGGAAVGLWFAVVLLCDGSVRPFRRFLLVVGVATVLLEFLRFGGCWGIDPGLQNLADDKGVCRGDMIADFVLNERKMRLSVGDFPFLAWAASLGLYAAISLAGTCLVIYIGFQIFWRTMAEDQDVPPRGAY